MDLQPRRRAQAAAEILAQRRHLGFQARQGDRVGGAGLAQPPQAAIDEGARRGRTADLYSQFDEGQESLVEGRRHDP